MHRLLTGLLGLILMTSTAIASTELTIERILASPSLSGGAPRSVALSPDSRRVTMLRPREADADRLDLWEIDLSTGAERMLVDSTVLDPDDAELSAEEKARRERKRIPGSRGIVEYVWSPKGDRLAFPLGGDVWIVDLDPEAEQGARRVESSEGFATDVRFSPKGSFISFVRDQDLFVVDLATQGERKMTRDGGETIKNGMAEFVAQEEMGRYTGYWWSPDERFLAFARVDESPVQIARRHEIFAERVDVVEQRYPYAGSTNVAWDLRLVELSSGKIRSLDLGDLEDTYLYRVDWFPDSSRIAVQTQPRSQQRLDLLSVDATSGKSKLLVSESSDTWIELQDDLTFLEKSEELVWSSRRSGYQHLELRDWDGKLIRPLTSGEWEVATGHGEGGVLGVDEDRRVVLFMATADSPLERHLYEQSLDTDEPTRVTRLTEGQGTHAIELAEDAKTFVDTFSSPDQPPRVSVHRADGGRLAWLTENALVEGHPYFPYLADHPSPIFGELEAEDGQTLHTRTFRPSDFDPTREYPVLVYVYGGLRGQNVQRAWGGAVDLWLRWMTRRGYVVFTLDNRGTGFRGARFDDPLYRQLGDIEVRDQLVGIEWLREQPWVDADHIGIFGWSYGGYMALQFLSQAPGAVAAGVSGAPVTDWTLYDTYYTERFLDRPQDNADGYEKSGVFPQLGNLADPLLVIHGMADDNVLFTNATKLFQALQEANKRFEMMTYPGAKHSLCRVPGTGEHCLGTITAFLDRHLMPASSSESVETE